MVGMDGGACYFVIFVGISWDHSVLLENSADAYVLLKINWIIYEYIVWGCLGGSPTH